MMLVLYVATLLQQREPFYWRALSKSFFATQ